MDESQLAFYAEAILRYKRYIAAVPTDPTLTEYRRVMAIEDPTERTRQGVLLAGRGWRQAFGLESV